VFPVKAPRPPPFFYDAHADHALHARGRLSFDPPGYQLRRGVPLHPFKVGQGILSRRSAHCLRRSKARTHRRPLRLPKDSASQIGEKLNATHACWLPLLHAGDWGRDGRSNAARSAACATVYRFLSCLHAQLRPKSPRHNGDFLDLDGPHGFPFGIPGIGDVMLGAIQHAPQPERQCKASGITFAPTLIPGARATSRPSSRDPQASR
jgi:hypothetical protein